MMFVEHGSSIEYVPEGPVPHISRDDRLDQRDHRLFASGRQALISLLRAVGSASDIDRVLLPDHYCHATTKYVSAALEYSGTQVHLYPATFGSDLELVTGPADLLVINAVFGVVPRWIDRGRGIRVLDATHAPDLIVDRALGGAPDRFDYVFASLRKMLPVTDGGLVKAANGRPLPDDPEGDPAHDASALELERLLTLKKHYVDGAGVKKADFYPRIKDLEASMFRGGHPCSISGAARRRLARIDVVKSAASARRNANLASRIVANGLAGRESVRVLPARTFVVLLGADRDVKARLVKGLIERNIYPATLWPTVGVEGVSAATEDLVSRSLAINADARYSVEHMRAVAATVLSVFG